MCQYHSVLSFPNMNVNKTKKKHKCNKLLFFRGTQVPWRATQCLNVFSGHGPAAQVTLRLLCWGPETANDTAYNRHLHNHDFRGQD